MTSHAIALKWNSGEYVVHTRMLTVRQRGELLGRIDAAVLRGDLSELSRYPWIEGASWHRVNARPSVRAADRRAVLAAGRCASCGSTADLTVDHIRPLARGGSNERSNLQCLCWPCNHKKRDRWDEA